MARNQKAGSVVIRLDLRGQEDLMRRLDALGPAGQRVGRDLSRAMQPIKREGKLAKATILELGDAVDGVVASAGPFGRMMSAMGPWGYAGAAAMGLVAAAIREMLVLMERANQTADFAASVTNVSRVAGVAAENVLVFRDSLTLARGEAGQADRALEEFSKRLGEYRSFGTGEAREGLSALGLEALGASDLPVEQALDRVLERLAEIEDPARRLALADKLGLRDAAPLLQRTGDEITRIREQAELANQALTDGALARFAEAADRIAESELRQERARQIQSQALLGAEVTRQNALARFEEQKAALLLSRVALEDRTLSQLELQAGVLQEQITRYRAILGDSAQLVREQRFAVDELGRMEERLGRINEALSERQRIVELTARAEADLAGSFVRAPSEFPSASNDNADTLSAERRLELEALTESRIRGLMTPVQQLAELESDLNTARRAGLEISADQIDAILAQERARLGLVASLDEELRLRQDLLDMAVVVPRLRPKSPVGASEGFTVETDETANKAKERAYEMAQAQSDRALGGLRRMAEEAGDTAGQIDDLATGSLRIMSGELGLVAENAQSAGEAFENMGRRMLSMLVELAMQRYVLGPIAGALFGPLEGLFSGGGGLAKGTGSKLPGFDRGFEGLIRGNPGIDNNVLALNGRPFARVSDGEPLMIGPSLGQRAQPNVTVNVIGAPGGARVEKRQTDNGLELDVILDLVRETAANTAVEVSAAAVKRTQNGMSQALAQQTALKG